jgi:hypothetical protein
MAPRARRLWLHEQSFVAQVCLARALNKGRVVRLQTQVLEDFSDRPSGCDPSSEGNGLSSAGIKSDKDASAFSTMDWGPICHDRQYLFFTERQRLSLLAIRGELGNSKRMPTDSARCGRTKLSVWILAPVDSISLHEIAKTPQCLLRNTAVTSVTRFSCGEISKAQNRLVLATCSLF